MIEEYIYNCIDCKFAKIKNLSDQVCYCVNENLHEPAWHLVNDPACHHFELKKPEPYNEVDHPEHYCSGDIQCIDAIKASMPHDEFLGYLKGNCIKYLWRYDKKGRPETDILKARFYLIRLIDEITLCREEGRK